MFFQRIRQARTLYKVFTHNFLRQNDKMLIKTFELFEVLCIIFCGKMFRYLYTTDTHHKHYSVKIGFISFFNSSLDSFLSVLHPHQEIVNHLRVKQYKVF